MIILEELFCKLTASKAARNKPSLLSKLVWDNLAQSQTGVDVSRAAQLPGLSFPWVLGAQLSGKAEGMGLSLPCQHAPLGQAGNSHWGYPGHGTAAVILLAAGWSTGSVPTTTAMPFPPRLPHFHPTLSGLDSAAVAGVWGPFPSLL